MFLIYLVAELNTTPMRIFTKFDIFWSREIQCKAGQMLKLCPYIESYIMPLKTSSDSFYIHKYTVPNMCKLI